MPPKRKNTSSPSASPSPPPAPKRARAHPRPPHPDPHPRSHSHPRPPPPPPPPRQTRSPRARATARFDPASVPTPRLDPTYGQRGAFPGLDGGDGELFHGPAADGLAYLRMVRSEARTVPNLLVANGMGARCDEDGRGRAFGDEDGDGDEEEGWGYYDDGAYVAYGDGEENDEVGEGGDDAQEAFYAALLVRFKALRRALRSYAASRADATGGEGMRTECVVGDMGAKYNQWRYALLYTEPTMGAVGSMDQEATICALWRAETLVTRKNLLLREEGARLGAWCWVLLGRCREVGEMASEDVGVVRSLGMRASGVGWKLHEHKSGERGAYDGDQLGGDGGVGEENAGDAKENGGADEADQSRAADGKAINDAADICVSTVNTSVGTSSDLPAIKDAAQPALDRAQHAQAGKSKLQPPQSSGDDLQDRKAEGECDDVAETLRRALASLDIIVTIVGEFYGQRDLLESRAVW